MLNYFINYIYVFTYIKLLNFQIYLSHTINRLKKIHFGLHFLIQVSVVNISDESIVSLVK